MATHDDAVYRFRLRCETGAQFETGVDYREQHDPARIGFVCVLQHFPVLADPVGNTCEIGRIARHCRKPIAPFDRALGSAKPALGEQRRGQSVLRGVADPEAFRHAANTFDEARGLCCGMTEGPGYALRVEPEQAGAGGRRPKNSAGRGDVPAASVMCRHHTEPDAARNLDAENKRLQQFAAGHWTQPGQCEQSRRDSRRWVHHRSEMRVVVFEDIGADRVQKSGIESVGPIASPDHNPLRRPEKRRQHFDRDAHSFVLRATECTADKVQQPAYALAPHLRRDRFPLRAGDELRQPVRDMRLIAGQMHLPKSPENPHLLLPCGRSNAAVGCQIQGAAGRSCPKRPEAAARPVCFTCCRTRSLIRQI